MAQRVPVLKPEEVAELLSTLHAHGYRLRKIGADSLEVEDVGPKLTMAEPEPAQRQEQADPDDGAMWDHVNGRPPWLRKPERRSNESPWADKPDDD